MMTKTPLFALLLASTFAHAEIHRCTIDEQNVYQDSPCGGGAYRPGGGISVYQAPPPGSLPSLRSRPVPQPDQVQQPSSQSTSSAPRRASRNEQVRARADGRLAIGMSEATAIQILGHPDNYRSERLVRDRCKSYVWRNPRYSPGFHRAVICNGEVSQYAGPRN